MIQVKIEPADSGKKLHRYLRQRLSQMPLSGIYKMIRVGRVKINGKKGKMDSVLQPGDELMIYMPDEEFATLSKPKPKFTGMKKVLDVIFEDEHLLVVNKPTDLLTHPDRTEHKDTLINRALAYLYHQGEIPENRAFMPATVNRLDRNTSGLVLIGKDGDTLRRLSQEIREHRLQKTYLTIVHGMVMKDGMIDAPLLREQGVNKTFVARRDENTKAMSARTTYHVLAHGRQMTLLEVDIESGRTHQIRAHLKSIGHPLIGDSKYGGQPVFGLTYHLLHAYRLTLADGKSFVAPLPDEFQSVLEAAGIDFID
nr:RluA family pseudouridine synthase [Bacilli bacterium]